jgi:hypothetical protein
MPAPRKIIVFELNEVPLRVVRYYAERHPRSTFAKLLESASVGETVSPDEGILSPWITWPTVHRGVANHKHHISVLGQDTSDTDKLYPPVWQILADSGRRVGVFGSLQSYPLPDRLDGYAFFVPDTFAAGPECHPEPLSAFQRFNLSMVDKSGRNVSRGLPVRSGMDFIGKSPSLGVRAATLGKIAAQVVGERMNRHKVVRRRTMQSVLSFDLFLHQMVKHEPDAAFYFTNHVASAMHRYWPATFTDDYSQLSVSEEWKKKYGGEIDYSMREADAMLADLVSFVEQRPDYVLLIASSMGQDAVDDPANRISTQIYLSDPPKLMAALGITGAWERRRTMEPRYTFRFEAMRDAQSFADSLSRLTIADEPVLHSRIDPTTVELKLGQSDVAEDRFRVRLNNIEHDPAAFGLHNVVIQDEIGSAAYHVPEGSFICFDPRGKASETGPLKASTTQIAPTLLAMSGVAPPAYMEDPISALVAD